jgi:hypothetical protein
MSADNYTVCPRCRKRMETAKAEKLAETKASYGKVSEDAYRKAVRTADRENTRQIETLAEYYDLGVRQHWIGRTGDWFHVRYDAKCSDCGFEFHFEHSEEVKT